MPQTHKTLEQQLTKIVHDSGWFMQALSAAQDMNFSLWCIGAGAVRNLVWDHLHGYSHTSYLHDIDLAYFDPDENIGMENKHQTILSQKSPDFPWEVTNQAYVHCWYKQYFGYTVPALTSLESAIATWPEYATSVGITLTPKKHIQIIAPYGLDDLFAMYVRRNPKRVDIATYRQRILSKRYQERWPQVTIFPE